MNELYVFWGEQIVGRLTDSRTGLSFTYEDIDSPMISVAMPPARRPYRDALARPFFHGLLPEGEARRIIAYDLKLRSDGGTDFEMLAALGTDCAGALVISADDRPPPFDHQDPAPLSDSEIASKLRELPNEPLGVTGDVRVSLTGMQPKLPLTRLSDGTWVLPTPSRPSTHILKPASRELPDSVANEVFCMKLAVALGVEAATTDLFVFNDMPALISTRYDRRTDDLGSVARVHQEDGCQALSILVGNPRAKYQRAEGGPSLMALAATLDQWGPSRARYELLDHVLVTVAVGNADFHGKNVSFLHHRNEVRLAPMYDIMSTVGLATFGGQHLDSDLGMWVGGSTDVHEVGLADVLEEARIWGLRQPAVDKRVNAIIEHLPDAIDQAASAVPSLPEERLEVVRARAERLRVDSMGCRRRP